MKQLFWLCILIILIYYMKKSYIRISKQRKYLIYITIISAIYTIIYFYMGFIFGFAKSPYSHEIFSILKNVIMQMIPTIGIEITRNVLIMKNKNKKSNVALVTILLILLEINYNTLVNVYNDKENLFKYICSDIVPLIACSILYTYLTMKLSYAVPLIYRTFKELIIIVLPILPNLDWFVKGAYDMLSPVIIYVIFKYKFIKEKQDIRKKKNIQWEKITYAVTLIISITLICFMQGTFKYEPISILSNSMVPTFSRGDVVIFRKPSEKELKEIPINSIIIYTMEEQNIAHRIVNIIQEKDTVMYQTKGDNNNVPDTKLVNTNQIKGIYSFNIKYIGFPSVWLYDYFNNENAKVETK